MSTNFGCLRNLRYCFTIFLDYLSYLINFVGYLVYHQVTVCHGTYMTINIHKCTNVHLCIFTPLCLSTYIYSLVLSVSRND